MELFRVSVSNLKPYFGIINSLFYILVEYCKYDFASEHLYNSDYKLAKLVSKLTFMLPFFHLSCSPKCRGGTTSQYGNVSISAGLDRNNKTLHQKMVLVHRWLVGELPRPKSKTS